MTDRAVRGSEGRRGTTSLGEESLIGCSREGAAFSTGVRLEDIMVGALRRVSVGSGSSASGMESPSLAPVPDSVPAVCSGSCCVHSSRLRRAAAARLRSRSRKRSEFSGLLALLLLADARSLNNEVSTPPDAGASSLDACCTALLLRLRSGRRVS
ncbi:hypothetical protein PFISCL1PPCAC_29122, partial [Pristionchus fissidentatus]